jgi:hypothetical protein
MINDTTIFKGTSPSLEIIEQFHDYDTPFNITRKILT